MAGDRRFLDGLDELRALHLSKGADYADAGDPLRNYQVSADDNGVPAWRAAQLRLSEKYHRLMNLTRGGERAPNHESLDDTLLDLAAMSLIVRSLRARVSASPTPDAADEPAHRWQHADPGDEAGA
jgi:hypothetical protein